jgi:hypothetical protein
MTKLDWEKSSSSVKVNNFPSPRPKKIKCSTCRITKPLDSFNKKDSGVRNNICKACGRKRFRENGPYKNKAKNKAWKNAIRADEKNKAKAKIRFVEPRTQIGEIYEK